jgi:hypothetical protein
MVIVMVMLTFIMNLDDDDNYSCHFEFLLCGWLFKCCQ